MKGINESTYLHSVGFVTKKKGHQLSPSQRSHAIREQQIVLKELSKYICKATYRHYTLSNCEGFDKLHKLKLDKT